MTDYIMAIKQLEKIEDDLEDALLEAAEILKSFEGNDKFLFTAGIRMSIKQVRGVKSFLTGILQDKVAGREVLPIKCKDCTHVRPTAVLWCGVHDMAVRGEYFCGDGEARDAVK